ncbi:hypothetical protein ACGFZP_05130 [Kitasatospora sp. NPDC048239]|uniref:hypothetical protein n=1 Tax=Kitasatospora sp. NPDC048239 TaxID=3364046 RepID=UPI003715057C
MSLPALATAADAAALDYALPPARADALLAKASVRIRRAAGQPITPSTVVVQLDSEEGSVVLPAPPVITVQQVQAVTAAGTLTVVTGWVWDGERLRLPDPCTTRVQVTYQRGWTVVPDGLVDLTCQVAQRLADTPTTGMATGIRSEQIDDYSVTYAVEQLDAAGDLLPGERTALADALGAAPTAWVVKS